MIGIIARKELRVLFASPLAWVILAVVQAVLAYAFLGQLDAYLNLQPQLARLANPPGFTESVAAPLHSLAALMLMVAVPVFSMRLIAEERRHRSLVLLYAAPVSPTEIILGKFLGLMGFLCVIIAAVALMSLSLYLGGHADGGLLGANLLGLLLFAAACGALGLYCSTLTQQPAIAATLSLGGMLGLWLLGVMGEADVPLQRLSPLRRLDSFSRGLLDSGDLVFLLLFTAAFLALAILRLDSDRWR
jgi:ABC-2 type transport system permease protein